MSLTRRGSSGVELQESHLVRTDDGNTVLKSAPFLPLLFIVEPEDGHGRGRGRALNSPSQLVRHFCSVVPSGRATTMGMVGVDVMGGGILGDGVRKVVLSVSVSRKKRQAQQIL
jgi:hypothetical protein